MSSLKDPKLQARIKEILGIQTQSRSRQSTSTPASTSSISSTSPIYPPKVPKTVGTSSDLVIKALQKTVEQLKSGSYKKASEVSGDSNSQFNLGNDASQLKPPQITSQQGNWQEDESPLISDFYDFSSDGQKVPPPNKFSSNPIGFVSQHVTSNREEKGAESEDSSQTGRGGGHFSGNTLIVKDWPAEASKKRFSALFSSMGDVVSARLAEDEFTGDYLGCGFVTFSKYADALKALSHFDGFKFEDKKLKISFSGARKRRLSPNQEAEGLGRGVDPTILRPGMPFSSPPPISRARSPPSLPSDPPPPIPTQHHKAEDDSTGYRLLVNNLPSTLAQPDLDMLFSPFGEIRNSKIIYDVETGQSSGSAYVVYAREKDAENAIENLSGVFTLPGSTGPIVVQSYPEAQVNKPTPTSTPQSQQPPPMTTYTHHQQQAAAASNQNLTSSPYQPYQAQQPYMTTNIYQPPPPPAAQPQTQSWAQLQLQPQSFYTTQRPVGFDIINQNRPDTDLRPAEPLQTQQQASLSNIRSGFVQPTDQPAGSLNSTLILPTAPAGLRDLSNGAPKPLKDTFQKSRYWQPPSHNLSRPKPPPQPLIGTAPDSHSHVNIPPPPPQQNVSPMKVAPPPVSRKEQKPAKSGQQQQKRKGNNNNNNKGKDLTKNNPNPAVWESTPRAEPPASSSTPTKIFVGYLSAGFNNKAEIYSLFVPFGKVSEINLIHPKKSKNQIAFVEMERARDAEAAVKELSRKEVQIEGKKVKIQIKS